MKQLFTAGLFVVLTIVGKMGFAQTNVGGFWLGVTYPSNPNQAIYNYALQIFQTNTTFTGTTQTSNPSVPFGGVAALNGTAAGSTVTFTESPQPGNTSSPGLCYWKGTLTYNPTDESLIGTYENIVGGTCLQAGGGKVELYRVVLKSIDTVCQGSVPRLVVTGKNIRWYSSPAKTNLLATGNTYSPTINQTTTFYITQTLYSNESPAIPITIKVVDPMLTVTPTNTGCDKSSGSLVAKTTGSTDWQYSLNGGTFQTSPFFSSLKPGSYTVVATNSGGCKAQQTVTITTDAGPTISNVISTPPKCATANGQVSVVAAGGKSPLRYSIDYGVTYQSGSTFSNLAGGAYTLRVRDENGCEVNGAISLPTFKPMAIASSAVTPTSCGQSNGQVSISIAGGTKLVQYSLDSQTFQTTGVFSNLKSGPYTATARDSAGCTVSQSVSVGPSTGPQLADVRTADADCGQTNGAIYVSTARATDQYNYSIDGQRFQRTTNFTNLKADNYTLTVMDDQNCSFTLPLLVKLNCPTILHLPTAFSPNHDNRNDALTVHFVFPTITVSRFTVYDRWGSVVYNRANFVMTSGEAIWDGQFDGQALQMGTYTYRIDCQFPDGTQTTYRESVTLLH